MTREPNLSNSPLIKWKPVQQANISSNPRLNPPQGFGSPQFSLYMGLRSLGKTGLCPVGCALRSLGKTGLKKIKLLGHLLCLVIVTQGECCKCQTKVSGVVVSVHG